MDELKKNTKYDEFFGIDNALEKCGRLMILMISYYNYVIQCNLEVQ